MKTIFVLLLLFLLIAISLEANLRALMPPIYNCPDGKIGIWRYVGNVLKFFCDEKITKYLNKNIND